MLTGNDVAVLLAILATSITLAGFSGIITMIDRRAAPASSEVIAFRLRNLTGNAISATVLALLPIILDAFQIATHSLWPLCLLFATISLAGTATFGLSKIMDMTSQSGRGLSRALAFILLTVSFIVIIVDISAIAGFVPARGAYFLTLSQNVVIMLAMFYRIVLVADEAMRASQSPR